MAKIDPKSSKISNLKVDALPHRSTDSTHIYRLYYPTIPLSIAGNKNVTCIWPRKKVALKFPVLPKAAKSRPKIQRKFKLKS